MAELTVRALVLRETPFGDYDAYQSLLARDGRRIEVFCKNIRRKKKAPTGARQFCDSTFFLWEKNGKYRLHEAEVEHDFWDLTQNIEHYALACYLCELTAALTDDNLENEPLYELLWLAFYALTVQKRETKLIKAAFEMRAMAESGYAVDFTHCMECGKQLAGGGAYFASEAGAVLCLDCARPAQLRLTPLSQSNVSAMQHIMAAKRKRLYAFSLGGRAAQQLARLTENYVCYHLDRNFETLQFLHSLEIEPTTHNRGKKE